ncbi:MAG: VWA domain-containing protein, partial [Myxococcales bacterium]|nr:VWA domain-containing protein [Myxococcales bacterium]
MTLSFARPEWLWLLLAVPVVLAMARGSKRPLARRRWWLVLALRGLLMASLVMALAEPEIRRQVDDLAVLFVVDGSASVGAPGQQQALDYVQEALRSAGSHDQAGVVLFGADAVIEQAPRERLEVNDFESRPSPHQTDIGAGLRLGAALLPADRTRRVVLLTDGEQTRGDAAEQALLVRDQDLELLVVALEGHDLPEVLLEDLLAPPHVEIGATYDLKVVARSDEDVTGTLRMYVNARYLGEQQVELQAGRSRVVTIAREAPDPGLYRFPA